MKIAIKNFPVWNPTLVGSPSTDLENFDGSDRTRIYARITKVRRNPWKTPNDQGDIRDWVRNHHFPPTSYESRTSTTLVGYCRFSGIKFGRNLTKISRFFSKSPQNSTQALRSEITAGFTGSWLPPAQLDQVSLLRIQPNFHVNLQSPS